MSDTEPAPGEKIEEKRGETTAGVSRRTLLTTGAASALVGAGVGVGGAVLLQSRNGGPQPWLRPDRSDAPRVGGLHLQFGADASSEVVVSWFTDAPVTNPRAMLGMPGDGFGRTVQAETRTYRDAKPQPWPSHGRTCPISSSAAFRTRRRAKAVPQHAARPCDCRVA